MVPAGFGVRHFVQQGAENLFVRQSLLYLDPSPFLPAYAIRACMSGANAWHHPDGVGGKPVIEILNAANICRNSLPFSIAHFHFSSRLVMVAVTRSSPILR
jgi:hypothetical protein